MNLPDERRFPSYRSNVDHSFVKNCTTKHRKKKGVKIDKNDLLLFVLVATSVLLIFIVFQTLKKRKKYKLSDVIKSTV
jgi:hypothetical protein